MDSTVIGRRGSYFAAVVALALVLVTATVCLGASFGKYAIPPAAKQPAYVADQVIVTLRPGHSPNELTALNVRYGAQVERKVANTDMYVLNLPVGLDAASLVADRSRIVAQFPAVAAVRLNRLYYPCATPNDEYYPVTTFPGTTFLQGQWDLQPDPNDSSIQHIYMPEAWDIQKGTPKVVVAVLDTGTRTSNKYDQGKLVRRVHPDLVGRLLPGIDFGDRDYDPSPTEDDSVAEGTASHGTHVAGTIAAQADNFIGMAGMCWDDVWVLPVKVFPDGGSGAATADIIDALYYTMSWAASVNGQDVRVNVINMSLGSQSRDDAYEAAIQQAIHQGIVVVASAGNSWGGDPLPPGYPSAYEGVICVGASDYKDQITDFSQHGRAVTITAPGYNTLSTAFLKSMISVDDADSGGDDGGDDGGTDPPAPPGSLPNADGDPELIDWPDPYGNTFMYMSGTSMSSPHVAAGAALLLCQGVPPADVRGILCETATPMGIGRPNDTYGWGILNVAAALRKASIDVKVSSPASGSLVASTRPSFRFDFRHAKKQSIRVWIDDVLVVGPAEEGAAIANIDKYYYTLDAAAAKTYLSFTYPVDPTAGVSGRHTVRVSASSDLESTSTLSGEDTHYFRIQSRKFEQGWHLISLPYVLDPPVAPENIFAEDTILWRYAYADGISGQYFAYTKAGGRMDSEATLEPPSVMSNLLVRSQGDTEATPPAGLGYWLYVPNSAGCPRPDGFGTPVDNQPYEIGLYKGWNLVGCPFAFPVQWSTLLVKYGEETVTALDAVSRGWIAPYIYNYDSFYQRYSWRRVEQAVMRPWEGQWVTVRASRLQPALIQNGNFEGSFDLGVASYWESFTTADGVADFVGDAIVGHSGTASKVQKVTFSGGSAGTYSAGVYQQVDVEAGVPYNFSVWTRRSGTWGAGDGIVIGIDPTGGIEPNAGSVVWAAPAVTSTGVWSQQTVRATAQTSAVTLFIKATSSATAPGTVAFFDDAKLAGGHDLTLIVPPTSYRPM